MGEVTSDLAAFESLPDNLEMRIEAGSARATFDRRRSTSRSSGRHIPLIIIVVRPSDG